MADYGVAISLSQAHTSDDDSSEQSPHSLATLSTNPGTASSSKAKSKALSTVDYHHHLQSAVDNSRKPRGRPPGSKNKPKPPIIITKDSDSAMKPAVLEISAGSDVIESIINHARRHHVGVSIISASGSVSNVTIRHPLSHVPSLSLHGPFNLLSLCGSFLAPSKSALSSSSSSSSFGITLAGAQGQIFGGIVAGKVVAATTVMVLVATFANPTFHRLPSEVDDGVGEETNKTNPNVGGATNECCSTTPMSMSAYGVANPAPINCQMPPPDVMPWGPTSRPPY